MSTSLLYHGWCLRGYDHFQTEYRGGVIRYHIRQRDELLACPKCLSSKVVKRGTVRREIQTLPIGGRRVFLVLDVQRVECQTCGCLRQGRLVFADERFHYARAFERYALGLLQKMTVKDVALHLGVGWDTIKEIQRRHLKRHYGKPKLKYLRLMAIDEIAIGAGHRYLTVVLNLETGAVVFVGEGKGADTLRPFWRRLRRSGATVEAVAIDMSQAYISAVQENLSGAAIVFDHFHVMKLFNDKLSDLRRDMQREAETVLQQRVLKGTRWLLLKNSENLNEARYKRRLSERERLDRALALNAPLAKAYYLKEDLRCFWGQRDKRSAAAFLRGWSERAISSGVAMLQRMAKTLAAHRSGLLAWYDHRISTAKLEGTNTKIRVMQRQSYGLRDKEYLKLKIYAIHKAKYALTG